MEDPWADTPPSPRPDRISTPTGSSTSSPLRPSVARQSTPPSPTSPVVASPLKPPPFAPEDEEEEGEGEDDGFDDFDAPEAGPSTFTSAAGGDGFGDEGFGDFGDFEEGDFDAAPMEAPPVERMAAMSVEERWQALRLRPVPSRPELLEQLRDTLGPLIPPSDTSALTDEPLRQVGGLRQIMISRESQDAYVQLNTPPMLKPLDWTRSRVRREHLISMGVPVNLDEVDSHKLSTMPPIRVSTGSMGPPPLPRVRQSAEKVRSNRPSVDVKGKKRESVNGAAAVGGAIVVSPEANGGGALGQYGLGDMPPLDTQRAEDLCGLEEDQISLMPLAALTALQEDLVEISAQASGQLAWQLQLKDAQTHDSATYNGMISELIANAAKAKSAQQAGSGGVFRSSSMKKGRPSGSGSATPRTSSPAIK